MSIIGPGRLGLALGIALSGAGYEIVSLVGRSRQKLQTTSGNLDASTRFLVTKELAKGPLGNLIIVAVPDDQIVEVGRSLAPLTIASRRTILHTSGALSSDIFGPLAAKGWHTGSIHPLASVSDPIAGVDALRNAYWCIEGDRVATSVARRVVRDLGGRSFSIKSNDKPLYHAAAVMCSGNMTALFDVALGMLEKCGVSRRNAQKMLLPLLESNTLNLSRMVPEDALTGTFARGDVETVKLHLTGLRKKQLVEALELYRLLGDHALQLVRERIGDDTAKEIERRLRDRS
ncbi:MAG TPA: Rossmann-like and DUF2520 domain-containing protein [Pyrinomonadaceae bacterium]